MAVRLLNRRTSQRFAMPHVYANGAIGAIGSSCGDGAAPLDTAQHATPRTGPPGFEALIEAKRAWIRRFLGTGFVSLVAHGAAIVAIMLATSNAGASSTRMNVDTAMVYLPYLAQQQHPPQRPRLSEAQPAQLGVPRAQLGVPLAKLGVALKGLKGFQTVVAPTEIPTGIPPINRQEQWNPEDYTGVGVEGGTATGVAVRGVTAAGTSVDGGTGHGVFSMRGVDELPSLLSAPEPQYPTLLRQAGIEGRVVIQAIIDTTGRIEPRSVKVLESSNPGFEQASRRYLLGALFRPGRVHGRAVRVLVNQPVVWHLTHSDTAGLRVAH
jgi:TonB family protein